MRYPTDRLARLLLVTLEAARLQTDLHPLPLLRFWLDSWRGIGAVERGMAGQGFDLQLTRYDNRGWRATFYTTGMEHSPVASSSFISEAGIRSQAAKDCCGSQTTAAGHPSSPR